MLPSNLTRNAASEVVIVEMVFDVLKNQYGDGFLSNSSSWTCRSGDLVRLLHGNEAPAISPVQETEIAERFVADLFLLLYGTVVSEVIIEADDVPCKSGRVLAVLKECASFKRLRRRTTLNPVISTLAVMALLDSMAIGDAVRGLDPEKSVKRSERAITSIIDDTERNEEIVGKAFELTGGNGTSGGEKTNVLDPSQVDELADAVDMRTMIEKRLAFSVEMRNWAHTDLFRAFGKMQTIKHEALDDCIDTETENTMMDQGSEITKADTGYLATRPLDLLCQDLADGTLEEISGEEEGGEGAGPVVVLIDHSSSMNHTDKGDSRRCDLATALCFNLIEQCKKDKRHYAVIGFTRVSKPLITSNDNYETDIKDLNHFLGCTSTGGTSFVSGWNAAKELLEGDDDRFTYENADIVWLTDGCVEGPENNFNSVKYFVEEKKKIDDAGCRVFTLNFGQSGWICKFLSGTPIVMDHFSEGPGCEWYCDATEELMTKALQEYPHLAERSDHKDRLTDRIEQEGDNNGIRTLFQDIKDRSSGLDWLN